jgi:purine-binding chemotaxis protein CheW
MGFFEWLQSSDEADQKKVPQPKRRSKSETKPEVKQAVRDVVPAQVKSSKSPITNQRGAKAIIASVAKQEIKAEDKIIETRQIVTFGLDQEEYASPITDLKEIIRIPEIVAVPGVYAYIRGIFNLRGQVVTVIDLEKRFELKREHPAKPRHVIIVEVEKAMFGILVDEVSGVLRIPVSSIKPAPPAITAKIQADYINGIIILDQEMTLEGSPMEEVETYETESQATKPKSKEATARMLLMLDLPRMLKEEDLMGFSSKIQKVAQTKPNNLKNN